MIKFNYENPNYNNSSNKEFQKDFLDYLGVESTKARKMILDVWKQGNTTNLKDSGTLITAIAKIYQQGATDTVNVLSTKLEMLDKKTLEKLRDDLRRQG